MDLINELAELALATRLKRLSERLSQDVSKIYKEFDINFESKWYLTLELLRKEKTLSIVEISEALRLSHPAVVQFVEQMLKRKLIIASKDKNDGRKRLISLAPAGKDLLIRIEPILQITRKENQKWLKEADGNLLKILNELEHALDKKSMYDRIKKGIRKTQENQK